MIDHPFIIDIGLQNDGHITATWVVVRDVSVNVD